MQQVQEFLIEFVACPLVALLLADLIGQVINFIRSLYIEIIFRA